MSPAICVARRTLVSVALHFAIAAAALLVMTCSPPVAAAPSFSPLVWLSPAFWHVTPPPYAVEPVRIDSLGDGRHFALHLSGRPPENFRMPAVSPAQVGPMAGTKILDGVPGMDWCYGCLPTATAIIMGYYDRRAYPNLYTGPSALGAGVKPMTVDGGVFPLNNSQWGIKECPLAATHMGIDGRTIRGYVDDYYYGYMSEREDRAGEVAGVLVELGLQALEKGEGIGGGAGVADHDLAVAEGAQLVGGLLEDSLADGDLTVGGEGGHAVAADGTDGGRAGLHGIPSVRRRTARTLGTPQAAPARCRAGRPPEARGWCRRGTLPPVSSSPGRGGPPPAPVAACPGVGRAGC